MRRGPWKKIRRDRVEVWTVDLPGALAVFTTRRGGTSHAPYHTMNLGPHTADDPQAVRQNLDLFMHAWGRNANRALHLNQVHSATVVDATSHGDPEGTVRAGRGDALISACPGDMLMTFHADCAPVYVVDPGTRIIGLGHAGWRGTALNIAGALVSEMARSHNCDPGRMVAAVGPCIGGCCYEIDMVVLEEMKHLPFLSSVVRRWGQRWRLDLEKAQVEALAASGLSRDRIYPSRLCTHCRPGDFFSHRRDGSTTGRMIAALRLVE